MLSIVTFNCQKAFQPDFEPFIQKTLQEKTYDFLLLQEADQKVREILAPLMEKNGYLSISVMSPRTNKLLNITIVYKKEFEFMRSDYITFTPMVFHEFFETGSVAGVFRLKGKYRRLTSKTRILLISAHLHASYHSIARRKELVLVKRQAQHIDPKNECLQIIGGDMNNLLPGEGKMNDITMAPEYSNVSNFETHTYDSAFIEPKFKRFPIAKLFFKAKKSYHLKLDYLYMDTENAKRLSYISRPIPVNASDHRPVELVFEKKRIFRIRRKNQKEKGS